MTGSPVIEGAGPISAQLEAARAATLAFVRDLDDEALCAQPDPAFSPIGWHLGHVAFTEAQWILGRCCGDDSLSKPHARAWAQAGCPKHERRNQPAKDALFDYLREVRERVLARLPALDFESADPLLADGFVGWLVEAHEHQHLETMKIVRQLQLERRLSREPPPPPRASNHVKAERVEIAGGVVVLGTDARLAYDNERPAHEERIEPFAIDRSPATVADWERFRAEKGYERAELWSVEGWAWREREAVRWPRGWTRNRDGQLAIVRGEALWPLAPDDVVQGVSFHEAEAFARFSGARLPTEAEWEHAAGELARVGQAWEWTASAFAPYPGFCPFPYRGYSEPYFDGAHRVLRGGSSATHPRIARRTFRNWYLPEMRQLSAGVRCAHG